jgi:hypothetical protein
MYSTYVLCGGGEGGCGNMVDRQPSELLMASYVLWATNGEALYLAFSCGIRELHAAPIMLAINR